MKLHVYILVICAFTNVNTYALFEKYKHKYNNV